MAKPSSDRIVRLYGWIALVAFLCGFAGYLTVRVVSTPAAAEAGVRQATGSPWGGADSPGPPRIT